MARRGIGFAIPVNMVKQILPMLLRDGHFTRSGLGVEVHEVRELSPEEKSAASITVDKGVVIDGIEPGGAANQAGLQAGDVIVGFEGQTIERASELQWLASTAGVGRVVTVRVARGAKLFEVKVTLGQLQERGAASGISSSKLRSRSASAARASRMRELAVSGVDCVTLGADVVGRTKGGEGRRRKTRRNRRAAAANADDGISFE